MSRASQPMNPRPKRKRVTLATVAEHAGVSVTTVSVVLSGREEVLKLYHPATVQKVRDAADRLGYRANIFATGLPTKSSPFFALIIQDLRKQALGAAHTMGYEALLLSGVIGSAMERRLYPIVASVPAQTDVSHIQDVARIIDGGVLGTIVRSPDTRFEEFLTARYRSGHPIAVVFPQRIGSWPSNAIDVDNMAIGRTAARLLAERQRKHWALVCYEKTQEWDRARCRGFLDAARKLGVSIEMIRLPMEKNEFETRDIVLSQLRGLGVDGVFAAESTASVGSLLALVDKGMKPAEDVDLVGCDCASWQGTHVPRITCVDVSWEHVGMRAIQELAGMHENGTSRFRTLLVGPRVVPAGTCPVPKDLLDSPEAFQSAVK